MFFYALHCTVPVPRQLKEIELRGLKGGSVMLRKFDHLLHSGAYVLFAEQTGLKLSI